jgi:uncharacterized alpha-E superfamily protein
LSSRRHRSYTSPAEAAKAGLEAAAVLNCIGRDLIWMPESHPATCRQSAERCRRRAQAAQDAASKAAWLKLAEKWLELAEESEQSIAANGVYLGFSSRANAWASTNCVSVIRGAILSRFLSAALSPLAAARSPFCG